MWGEVKVMLVLNGRGRLANAHIKERQKGTKERSQNQVILRYIMGNVGNNGADRFQFLLHP
jgi:hypothetical protein